jgi:hypothetical protein
MSICIDRSKSFQESLKMKGAIEQVIGCESEITTLLSRCLLTLSLRVAVSPQVNSAIRLFLFLRKVQGGKDERL